MGSEKGLRKDQASHGIDLNTQHAYIKTKTLAKNNVPKIWVWGPKWPKNGPKEPNMIQMTQEMYRIKLFDQNWCLYIGYEVPWHFWLEAGG